MALDELRENDTKHTIDDLSFVVADDERESVFGTSGVLIDYKDNWLGAGFTFNSLDYTSSC